VLPEAGELRLLANTKSIRDGRIEVAFVNFSAAPVRIGLLECWTGTEREAASGEWTPVNLYGEDTACPLPAINIGPKGTYLYTTLAPADPGRYRFVISANVEGDQPHLPGNGDTNYRVTSQPFVISSADARE
jgi:hypothetical protein